METHFDPASGDIVPASVPAPEPAAGRVSATEPGSEPPAAPVSSSAIPAGTPPLVPAAVPELQREFAIEGVRWIARVAGGGAGGTGRLGLAALEAVRFYVADTPDKPVRELLIGAGRLEVLFESELRGMWQRATVLDT